MSSSSDARHEEEAFDALVAAFIDDFHRLDEETLRVVARSVSRGQIDMRSAVCRVAEMLEVSPPDDIFDRGSPAPPPPQQQRSSADTVAAGGHTHACISKLRAAKRTSPPPPAAAPEPRRASPARSAAAAAARQHPHAHRNMAGIGGDGGGISTREIADLCDGGFATSEALRQRAEQIRELRRAWNKGVGECIRVAKAQLEIGAKKPAAKGGKSPSSSPAAERHLAVVLWVGELASQQRMKERVDLPSLPAVLGIISAALGDLSNARGSGADGGLLACIDAARAMHSRFDGRIAALIASGGSVDAVNAAQEARMQFQVLQQQLSHHGDTRHDEVGDRARQFCGLVGR